MNSPFPIAVLGAGRLADRIAAHPDVVVAEPSSAAVVLHLSADVSEIPFHLGAGRDVVTALPLDALPLDEVRDACRAGASTLHATGGFQSAVAARLTRSLAAATKEITRIDLHEEINLPEDAVYPWDTVPDHVLTAYYFAGLRVLEDAAFADVRSEAPVVDTEESGAVHTLGDRISYRSIRTRGTGAGPLRYRLVTTTASGTATATVDFHPTDDVHPADHLTCVELLRAVRPVRASKPGIVLRDLRITHLVPDDRLAILDHEQKSR
ncbi:hypothetical protein [Nocardia aurantiaca]|uniref:Dihydrodipicolinate reductase n=1 Tax=Nocardia aurantiaca TaxID=2675850 RepID=A0A6I3KZG3_9NOCA|nr:hypothetical protein [Nocardia aurantiaca]MTE13634.1 hypothetical protein [Nocardia aurantiaca]